MSDDRLIAPYLSAAAEGLLVLPTCGRCGTVHWYPLPLCPACQGTWSWQPASPRATLVTWTVVHHAFSPELAGHVPYLVALAEPDGAPGVHLVTTVIGTDANRLSVGMRLAVDFAETLTGTAHLPVYRVIDEPVG
jgi:uncharacterized OB-fold protein